MKFNNFLPILGFALAASQSWGEAGRLPIGTAATKIPTQPAPQAAPAPTASDAPLIGKATPAVVSVFPAQLLEEGAEADPLKRFFKQDRSKPGEGEKADPDAQDNQRVQGVGSGVILTADGYIVTNSHVVHFQSGKLADAVSVKLSDYRYFDAVIVGVDPLTDLALLKIASDNLPTMPLGDSDAVAVGDPVYAVGNPFKIGITATKGMVSALRRANLEINGPNGYESYIQTDAAINPGNSGGALINGHGQLVGINSAIWGGHGGNVGIGFAIPTNLVQPVLVQLAEQGKMQRGFSGVQISEVGKKDAQAVGLASVAGAKISDVMAGGPGAKAGLKSGDVIVEAKGRPIYTRGDLRLVLSLAKPQDAVKLTYQREGKRHDTELTLSENAKESSASADFTLASLPGVTLRKGAAGLTVATAPKGLFEKTGLGVGMEIISVNDTEASDAGTMDAAFKAGVNKVVTKGKSGQETLAIRIPLKL